MGKKYKMFLNILVTILVIAGIGLLGYLAYDYISSIILTKEAEAAVDEFMNSFGNSIENNIQENVVEKNVVVVNLDEQNIIEQNEEINNSNTVVNNNSNNSNSNKSTTTYKDFNVIGSIQIPKTKIKYPVVDTITPDAVAVAVTKIYGPGLNEVRKYSISST